jgi:hypothetical protein
MFACPVLTRCGTLVPPLFEVSTKKAALDLRLTEKV